MLTIIRSLDGLVVSPKLGIDPRLELGNYMIRPWQSLWAAVSADRE